MAEIAGLALGVVGLGGLYGLVIEACGLVSVAKSMSRDLEVLATRYDIRRARLLQWGDGVALLSEDAKDHDPRLHSRDLQPLIARTLECIRKLLTDAGRLSGRYGLKRVEAECDGTTVGASEEDPGLLSRSRLQAFHRSYKKLMRGERTPLVSKARWVVHGAASFRLLLDDLDGLIEDLYALVPIMTRFRSLMVREDVDNLPEDMQALKLVEEAVAGDVHDSARGSVQRQDGSWLEAISLKVERSEQASLHKQHVFNWLRDVASPDLQQNVSYSDPQLDLSASLDHNKPHPTEVILTPEEYERKKKRRREVHNAVERRRRDAINDSIQHLWRLMPKTRVDEVVLEEKCQQYFRLPGQADATGTKIPLNPKSTTAEALSALAPFLDVDWTKYPNKGQILRSTERWVEELSEILVRKFAEEDRLRETIQQLGGWAPFERTVEDQNLREYITKCLRSLAESQQENAPAKNETVRSEHVDEVGGAFQVNKGHG